MDPLHATIEEFAADGYTHVECTRPRQQILNPLPATLRWHHAMDGTSWTPQRSEGLPRNLHLHSAML